MSQRLAIGAPQRGQLMKQWLANFTQEHSWACNSNGRVRRSLTPSHSALPRPQPRNPPRPKVGRAAQRGSGAAPLMLKTENQPARPLRGPGSPPRPSGRKRAYSRTAATRQQNVPSRLRDSRCLSSTRRQRKKSPSRNDGSRTVPARTRRFLGDSSVWNVRRDVAWE